MTNRFKFICLLALPFSIAFSNVQAIRATDDEAGVIHLPTAANIREEVISESFITFDSNFKTVIDKFFDGTDVLEQFIVDNSTLLAAPYYQKDICFGRSMETIFRDYMKAASAYIYFSQTGDQDAKERSYNEWYMKSLDLNNAVNPYLTKTQKTIFSRILSDYLAYRASYIIEIAAGDVNNSAEFFNELAEDSASVIDEILNTVITTIVFK